MKRDYATAAIYLAFFIPVAIFASAIDYVTLGLLRDEIPRFAVALVGWSLNLVPAAIAGAVPYAVLAYWRRPSPGEPSRHVVRAAPLYAIVILVGALVAFEWRDRYFGLVAQLFVWPGAAAIGGIIADAIVHSRTRRSANLLGPDLA